MVQINVIGTSFKLVKQLSLQMRSKKAAGRQPNGRLITHKTWRKKMCNMKIMVDVISRTYYTQTTT